MNDLERSLRSLPDAIDISPSPDLLQTVRRRHQRRAVRRRSGIAAVAVGATALAAVPGVLIQRNRDGNAAATAGATSGAPAEFTAASLEAALARLATSPDAQLPERTGRYSYIRTEAMYAVGKIGGIELYKAAGAPPPPDAKTEHTVTIEGSPAVQQKAVDTKGIVEDKAKAAKAAGEGEGEARVASGGGSGAKDAAKDAAREATMEANEGFSDGEVRVHELWLDKDGTGFKKSTFVRSVDFPGTSADTQRRAVDKAAAVQSESENGGVVQTGEGFDPASLPTDPAAMLALLTEQAGRKVAAVTAEKPQAETPPDLTMDMTFQAGIDLLTEHVLPLGVRAAIYRALLKVPGTVVANGVADFAGRSGVALGHANVDNDQLRQLIVDPDSWAVLGERDTLTKASPFGPAGTVVAHSAVQQTGFVDALKVRPTP